MPLRVLIWCAGYRAGEGVDSDPYPTASVCAEVARLAEELGREDRRTTSFTQYARGDVSYSEYTDALRAQPELGDCFTPRYCTTRER